jgi:hypothetical protein
MSFFDCFDGDDDERRHRRRHQGFALPIVRLVLGPIIITLLGDFDMQVPDSGGPYTTDVSGFLDAKGNPVTDLDAPVWKSSDPTIATVAVGDPTKPQEATTTLTGKTGQVQITATFGDPTAGGFVVSGSLEVVPGPAVSASMTFAGPGITAPAPAAPAAGTAPAA